MSEANSGIPKLEPKNAHALRRFMWKFSIIAVISLTAIIYWFCYNVFSDGERTGLLTKLSRKGNLFKTYEGEMLIGNFNQAPNVMIPEKFYFSVEDKMVADSLMKLQGKQVSLRYVQYRRHLPWRGENQYIVTGIERIEK